jgi:gamma-tubulin complex component 3
MASFNRERVEHALNELLVRIVPEDPSDTEEAANQRFDEAYELAIDTLSAAGDPSIVPDVDHIADLITRRSTVAAPTRSLRCTDRSSLQQRRHQERPLPQPPLPAGVAARPRPEMAHAVLPPPAVRPSSPARASVTGLAQPVA